MNTMIYHMMELCAQDLKRKAEGQFSIIPWTRNKSK